MAILHQPPNTFRSPNWGSPVAELPTIPGVRSGMMSLRFTQMLGIWTWILGQISQKNLWENTLRIIWVDMLKRLVHDGKLSDVPASLDLSVKHHLRWSDPSRMPATIRSCTSIHTSGSPTFGKMTEQIVTGVYKDATMNDKHAYDEYSIYILYVWWLWWLCLKQFALKHMHCAFDSQCPYSSSVQIMQTWQQFITFENCRNTLPSLHD